LRLVHMTDQAMCGAVSGFCRSAFDSPTQP
jgi:hypothetical protein